MGMRRSTLGRAFATFQGRRPTGPRAVLAAVIGQAALDLAAGDVAAAVYFLSNDYRRHVELIGLPAHYLPAGVEAADLAALVEAAGRQYAQIRAYVAICHKSQRIRNYGASRL